MAKAEDRVFGLRPEEAPAEKVIVEGNRQVKSPLGRAFPPSEVQVISPGCEEELPLDGGQLGKLRARLPFEPGIFEKDDESGQNAPLGVLERKQQVERGVRVFACLSRQTEDECAEWKPVVQALCQQLAASGSTAALRVPTDTCSTV